MLIARFDDNYQRQQSLKKHCSNVAKKASENLSYFGLSKMGELLGWLHDLCKSMESWQTAIKSEAEKFNKSKGKSTRHPLGVPHAPPAAQIVYQILINQAASVQDMIALQALCMVIRAHHGYLMDGLTLNGIEKFNFEICDASLESLPDVQQYFEEIKSLEDIHSLWQEARLEMTRFIGTISPACTHIQNDRAKPSMYFMLGMLVRTCYSALIDADRLDAANFEMGIPEAVQEKQIPNWDVPQKQLENRLGEFSNISPINQMRSFISSSCFEAAGWNENLLALHAPTGGGKTLASLRWALERARRKGRSRIFYIVSYTTILDQVYGDYLDLFKDMKEFNILLHHSNIIPEETNEYPNGERFDHQNERQMLLAERWDADIILTTQVQFFNALFLGTGKAARRMRALNNAVIIFDEVQTIPVHLIHLFNLAVTWLTNLCDCDLLLSTATQPTLTQLKYPLPPARNIFSHPDDLFLKMKRVEIIDDRGQGAMSASELAEYLYQKQKVWNSVLVVLNTRTAARKVYDALKQLEILDVTLYLLSNDMCVKHRKQVIDKLKSAQNKACICISTQLIECGVDLSFGCGVRSLAGADNIWQTAGRCNRHGSSQFNTHPVYIIKCAEENLAYLKDIERAQKACEMTLSHHQQADDLQLPATMDEYYQYYYSEQRPYLSFVIPEIQTSIVDLLSLNIPGQTAFWENKAKKSKTPLPQAFHTAGKYFSVISNPSISLIVPYERGAQIILDLNAQPSLAQEKKLLKEAQLYTINIFQYHLQKLGSTAFIVLPNGAYALNPEWYDGDKRGLLFEPQYKIEDFIIGEEVK